MKFFIIQICPVVWYFFFGGMGVGGLSNKCNIANSLKQTLF
jgi:hypothetical protein